MYLRNTNRLQHDEEYDIYFHIHIQVKLVAICFEKLHFSLKAFYYVINKRQTTFTWYCMPLLSTLTLV